MKFVLVLSLSILLTVFVNGQEFEGEHEDDHKNLEEPEPTPTSSWWGMFKRKIKSVLQKWRDDLKVLWDDVLTKASDMKSWTAEMFDTFKMKLKQWLEARPEVPDDEKNEIETFISKLKLSSEKPKTSTIDP